MGSACRPFRKEEVPKIMAAFDGKFEYRNKALLALGICTGFRISELLSLQIYDVFYQGQVVDRISVPKRLMKGKNPRRPKRIYPEVKEHLERWYEQLINEFGAVSKTHLFLSSKGGPIVYQSSGKIIKDAAKAAGIPPHGISNHSMRKTFANAVYDYWSEQAANGERVEPMRMVQLELGHKDVETTYNYMEFKLEEKPDDVFSDYNLSLS